MSHRSCNKDCRPVTGLYRDRENGWVFGVCAGIADRFNFEVWAVRLVSVIGLFLFFWATALTYVALTLLIREKPLIYSGRQSEFDFWRHCRHDHWSHR